MWDSESRIVSTRELYVVFQVMSGKKLLNFQIEQWAEGINDGLFCMGEFQKSDPKKKVKTYKIKSKKENPYQT